MTSKSIPLLVANLDHLTSCSVSGLRTLRSMQGKPWSGPVAPSDKATGRKRGSVRKERNSFLRGQSKTLLSSNAESIQECFLSMIERSPGIPESGKVLIDCHINSEGKVFTTGVVSGMNSQTRNFRNALGLISAGSSFLFLHPETSFM